MEIHVLVLCFMMHFSGNGKRKSVSLGGKDEWNQVLILWDFDEWSERQTNMLTSNF